MCKIGSIPCQPVGSFLRRHFVLRENFIVCSVLLSRPRPCVCCPLSFCICAHGLCASVRQYMDVKRLPPLALIGSRCQHFPTAFALLKETRLSAVGSRRRVPQDSFWVCRARHVLRPPSFRLTSLGGPWNGFSAASRMCAVNSCVTSST